MPPALTYAEVGATRGQLPAGYTHVRASRVLGSGRELFQHAADDLLGWQAHRRAGLRVAASAARAAVGVTVTTQLRLGPVAVSAPCLVVYVLDEADTKGFAYGTLEGHPERGEEAFLLHLDPQGTVRFEIVAFSAHATWWARLGGPVSSLVQRRVTRRYLRALDPSRG